MTCLCIATYLSLICQVDESFRGADSRAEMTHINEYVDLRDIGPYTEANVSILRV